MAADKRPLIVHADASPGSQLGEDRLGIGDLDCELVATEAGGEDALIANVREAYVKPRAPLEPRRD
jgi:hypothetical protein